MPRYIDAELLESKYREGTDPQDPYNEIAYLLPEDIDSIPTADVEKIRHGYWQRDGMGNVECSICNGKVDVADALFNFNGCPYCFARIDEDREGDE